MEKKRSSIHVENTYYRLLLLAPPTQANSLKQENKFRYKKNNELKINSFILDIV